MTTPQFGERDVASDGAVRHRSHAEAEDHLDLRANEVPGKAIFGDPDRELRFTDHVAQNAAVPEVSGVGWEGAVVGARWSF